jgi:hypothetical protein
VLGLNDRIGAAGLSSTATGGRKAFVLVGLVALAIVLWTASSAKADVATKGELREVSTVTSAPGEVKPFVSVENEDYECTAKYSDVQSGAFTWVIGNCPKGSTLEAVVRRAHTESEPENYSLGGWVTGTFQGCGWIENDKFKPKAKKIKPTTTCSEISSGKYEVAESNFMAKHNAGAGDGYFVVNKTACPEYANYRPWSSSNLEQEKLRTAPAYARQEPGSSYPALKWRYTTKYNSTDGSGQYVMVRDDTISAGEGNWVFVPRSCLPATLPENESERVPNPPTVTTNAASGIQTPNATLNGSVNPNGVEAKYYFEYGTSPSFGLSTTEGNAGSGSSSVPESATLSGLAAGTTYYYRITAYSAAGTSSGGTQNFTTQPRPEAITTPASSVQQTKAVLNSKINPEGLDTKYYFEYGTRAHYEATGHYEKLTAEAYAGSGVGSIAENATITGIESGTTYDYRVVAFSSAGTTNGADESFKTLTASTPGVILSSSGEMLVYYVGGSNGAVDYWDFKSSSGWSNWTIGGETAPNTSPAVIQNPSSGEMWVYYVDKGSNAIDYWDYNPSSGWSKWTIGGEAAPGSSPTVVRNPTTGEMWVYYVNKSNNAIDYWAYVPSSGWSNWTIGGEAAANTSPSVARNSSSGEMWVYYVDRSSNAIDYWDYNPSSGWSKWTVGGEVAPGSSPTVVRNATSGEMWVYYVNKSNNAIDYWAYAPSTGWSNWTIGGEAAANTSPSVARNSSSGEMWVYYVDKGSNAIDYWDYNPSSGWSKWTVGGEVAPGSSPTVVRNSTSGEMWVYYAGKSNLAINYWAYSPAGGWSSWSLGGED